MTCMSVRTVNFEVTLQSIEKVSKHKGLVFRPMSSGIRHLNLPLASHFGGIFEIMVKAMKQAMKATIGRADLDEEEFKTTVSKMAYLINSRPIQAVSDYHDYDVLTDDKLRLSSGLCFQFKIQQHVWRRFQEEVIPLMGPRKKWCIEQPNLHEHVVIMKTERPISDLFIV